MVETKESDNETCSVFQQHIRTTHPDRYSHANHKVVLDFSHSPPWHCVLTNITNAGLCAITVVQSVLWTHNNALLETARMEMKIKLKMFSCADLISDVLLKTGRLEMMSHSFYILLLLLSLFPAHSAQIDCMPPADSHRFYQSTGLGEKKQRL